MKSTTEEHSQGNQMLEPSQPKSKEPKVPTGSQDQQVEVDKVNGSEVRTEVYNRECEACNRFLSSNIYRRSHVSRYHKKLLKHCYMCLRYFMYPWDFNRHLDTKHRKCKKCQKYLQDDNLLQDHMERDHLDGMEVQVEREPQCRGAINNKRFFSPCSRRGLLAYVYSGVFV